MTRIRRWTIREYDQPVPIVQEMAVACALPDTRIRELLSFAGERAARSLGLSGNPISVGAGGVRATDVAGMLRIAPAIELEVVPKFLPSSTSSDWREDFFYLANLSSHGRLLLSEKLAAGRAASRNIPSLVGRTIVSEYLLNRRRPLRSYRRCLALDFSIDGDVDPESIVLPDPDGFAQDTLVYDRQNLFNATISSAAKRMAREARDPDLQRQLLRISQDLGAQEQPRDFRNRRVPARARRWQPLFDLSRDVLRGFGLRYDDLPSAMPGFVVSTWQIWEDIITLALRLAFGGAASPQLRVELGSRRRLDIQSLTKATVTPDVTLTTHNFIVDAKYKTPPNQGTPRVTEADLYEALAFAKATGINLVELVYPTPVPGRGLGVAVPFEMIEVSGTLVLGIEVSISGIAKRGMLTTFANALASTLRASASPLSPNV